MATILLSAAGAAIGGLSSGTFLGLTGAVVGRAVGATLGRVIDQRLLGAGSDVIEQGRLDRFRLTGAAEGAVVARLFGQMRLGGQVIWSTRFQETVTKTGGGKGAPPQPKTAQYSYSVSLAVALCEGEVSRVGRIWADGTEIAQTDITMRVYRGTDDQMPDPKLEAVEGAGQVPAYRGIAYVVIEDLDLSAYGNRVPQLSFEVVRAADPSLLDTPPAPAKAIRGVAMMPGTGEYALATSPVSLNYGFGKSKSANINTAAGKADFTVALDNLLGELPNCRATSLIVSWFGDDLRAGQCTVKPKVEQDQADSPEMPWQVAGLTRNTAEVLSQVDGRAIYGGTPTDQSVIEAIEALNTAGQDVMFYPFLLMEILEGSGKPDPWAETGEQPALPWRGRITGEKAPGITGTPDQTASARGEVATFFGTASASDYAVVGQDVVYSGPPEWSYSRFILHCAALCAAAGGVESFCIGSEMRSLTQLRDESGFPAVQQFIDLAAEVRLLLPDAKLSYAADWSEYFGYHPQDGSGDVYFHLDPLWADANIDFIGIDNYMPLSDWRDGQDHADASIGWRSIYDHEYLQSNIEGGEGYDWYYPSDAARAAQRREAISDGAHGEDWIYRFKDLKGWWQHAHFNRKSGALEENLVPNTVDLSGWVGSAILGAGNGPDPFGGSDNFTLEDSSATAFQNKFAWSAANNGATEFVASIYVKAHPSAAENQVATYRITVQGVSNFVNLKWYADDPSVPLAPDLIGPGNLRSYGQEDVGGGWYRVWAKFTLETIGTLLAVLYPALSPGAQGAIGPIEAFGPMLTKSFTELTPYFPNGTNSPIVLSSTPWEPQSKPVRFTELGCAAIDKGTNQPNKFLDPKSSESAIPHFSNGRRDDLIQMQYLRAMFGYWTDPDHNGVSDIYGGSMIDMDHAYVWAWDARPWPAFPGNQELWSDGANHARGHWISGRMGAQPLADVVAEICEMAGIGDYDVSELFGFVRGVTSGDVESARARLQPLMLAYSFEAIERDGRLVFRTRTGDPDASVQTEWMAEDDEGAVAPVHIRIPEADMVGRIRLSHVEATGAYETRVAEAIFPDDSDEVVSDSDLPLVLTQAEANGIAERWLAEARVSRDSVSFALPPSRRDLSAGSVLALEDGSTWRIDKFEDAGALKVEAVRTEAEIYEPSDSIEESVALEPFVPPLPVSPVLMDLPLLTGEEVPHAPTIAVAAEPWPGVVAVYSAPSDSGYVLNKLVDVVSAVGTLETPLFRATPGAWDKGPALRVRMASGSLSSAEIEAVLNGANAAAIGDGDGGNWEVIQFASATLVGEDLWDISLRLRGQAGSDGIMPDEWPSGSLFVLLDGRQTQLEMPLSARGLSRHYRIGQAAKSYDHPAYRHVQIAFDGAGLRPYAPAHLKTERNGAGQGLSWIRRTRIDGDSWQGADVPLGEDSEAYIIRVSDAGGIKHEATTTTPGYLYSDAQAASDGITAPYNIEVAQISAQFGPGPFARIEING